MRLVQRATGRVAYCGSWEAVWDAALAGVPSELGACPIAITDRIEALHVALGAAREPARRAAWAAALHLFTGAAGALPSPELAYRDALAAAQQAYERALGAAIGARQDMLHGCVLVTAMVAWRLAVTAAFHASWRVAHLINRATMPDPWLPLVDLWRLGAAPAGASRGSFVVFLPDATHA
jgi:hypothetical protein